MPVQFTTDLPDSAGLSLDASVQSEMTASWDDTINNGEYRIEWKEEEPDTETSYSDTNSATVGEATTAYTIANLLDGEKYSVRIRTQTDHVTGSWLEAADITKLIAADAPTKASSSTTSVTIDWVRNSDFGGSQPVYRKRTDYDYPDGDPGRLVETASASATSVTDDTAQPDREYTYMIRALTQWVHADSPESDPMAADSIGLEDRAVPPRGWHVEVDHPSGTVLTPSVLDGAERRPRINEQPEFEIPVPRSETWLAEGLEEAPMRVWVDGQRQPIDTLADVEVETDQVVLHGRGGKYLERRIQEDVNVEATTEFVERVIAENTPYVANVDQPPTNETESVQQDVGTQDEWVGVVENAGLDRIPATVTNGTLTAQDAADPRDALQDHDAANASFDSGDQFNEGQTRHLTGSGQYVEFEITWPYDLPADSVGIALRDEVVDGANVQFSWDGTVLDEASVSSSGTKALGWTDIGSSSFYSSTYGGYQGEIGEDLIAGETHTLRVEAVDSTSYYVDVLAVYDQRYGFDFPNPDAATNAGGPLDGPQTKADAVTVRIDPAETVLSVVGGTLESTIDDLSGSQKVDITNAGDDALVEEPNSDTVSASWGSPGAEIQARFTLSRYGSQNDFPATGINGQTVDSFTLSALLDDTPLVINQTFDGDIMDILAGVAEDSNAISELTWDDAAGEIALEWTLPGQRTAGSDLDVVDYTTRKIPSNIQHVKVYGAAEQVREESLTVSIGEAVNLENQDIVPGTDRVVDAAGVRYRRGPDYEINRQAGTITALSGGDLQEGDEVFVDYEFKRSGTFETPEYSGDPREEHAETIPSLTSDRSCGQAAKLIIDQASTPLIEADVQLPSSIPTDLSLVEALDLEDVPGDALAIYENRSTANGLQLRMGSRERVRDTVQRIERRVEAASQRV